MKKLQKHKKDIAKTKIRIIRMPQINKELPWAFFDGGSQGEPPLGGSGAVIFFPSTRKKKIKYAIGQASNNKAELSTLWATLKVAKSS